MAKLGNKYCSARYSWTEATRGSADGFGSDEKNMPKYDII